MSLGVFTEIQLGKSNSISQASTHESKEGSLPSLHAHFHPLTVVCPVATTFIFMLQNQKQRPRET